METLKSFLKEFAIFDPSQVQGQTANPQDDDIQFDVSGQGGQDDTVVNVDPENKDDETECVCKCECPCCQKNRAEVGAGDDENIEVVDPKDDKSVDFNIDDEMGQSDDDDNDPTKDYNIF